MPKIRQIYNSAGVFVGTSPSSGHHFINYLGQLNNNFNTVNDGFNFPLIFPINRVQDISFSTDTDSSRINIKHFGDFGNIAKPILNNTEIQLNLNYLLHGLINDVRFGFLGNVPKYHNITGQMLYGTGRAPMLSGINSRDISLSYDSEVGYPFNSRDSRNIFIAIKKDNLDLNNTGAAPAFFSNNIDVVAFGDCYINSYRNSASINEIPNISLSFVCNNMEVYSSGSGCPIPALNPRNGEIYSGIKFNIPNNYQGNRIPTVFLPSELTIDIFENNTNRNLTNFGFNFNDIKIQSYNFGFDLNRNPLYSIGYKYPLDRRINWPVTCDLSFSTIVGENQSGSLTNLLKNDKDYTINLKLKYQRNSSITGVGIQYDFIKAKYKGHSFEENIGDSAAAQFNFITELYPNRINEGLFMSGYLGIPTSFADIIYLSPEDSYDDEILMENNDLFTISFSEGQKLLY